MWSVNCKKMIPTQGCFFVLFLIISLFSFFHFDSARIQISGMNWNIIQRQHVTSLSHFQKTAAEHFREEVRLGICVDKPGFGAINLKLVPAFSIRFLRFIQVFFVTKRGSKMFENGTFSNCDCRFGHIAIKFSPPPHIQALKGFIKRRKKDLS